MRSSLLASWVLGCGALLCSAAASALPINVGLTAAAGQHQWTSPGFGDPSYVGLSGWAWDATDNKWVPATMTSAQDANHNPGLGVCSGTLDANDGCAATNETNEIDSPSPAGSAPWQMIDMDITQLASAWTSLTITMLSVENSGEFTLLGSTCAAGDTDCALTTQALPVTTSDSGYCSTGFSGSVWTCKYSESYLTGLGITDIWIEANPARCQEARSAAAESDPPSNACDGVLLGSGLDHGFTMDGDPAHVPEPSELGMFGIGALMMGLLVGLRRRRRAS